MNAEIKILLKLTTREFDVLLNSLDYFKYSSNVFDYGEFTEECQSIRSKIIHSMEGDTNEGD